MTFDWRTSKESKTDAVDLDINTVCGFQPGFGTYLKVRTFFMLTPTPSLGLRVMFFFFFGWMGDDQLLHRISGNHFRRLFPPSFNADPAMTTTFMDDRDNPVRHSLQ